LWKIDTNVSFEILNIFFYYAESYRSLHMNLFPIFQGFVLGASMIIPIGAQNAFILNQGIKKEFHLTAAGMCMAGDVLLISIGIFGGSQLIANNGLVNLLLTWLGVIFLLGYGLLSFHSALFPATETNNTNRNANSLPRVIMICLTVTLLNPHAYIDTVVILGGVGGQFEGAGKINFAIGCMIASLVWFYGLAISAAKMSHILSRKKVKLGIDVVVGIVMWAIASILVLTKLI
jgi:L-lysine exporter family protein LysE/ArgO